MLRCPQHPLAETPPRSTEASGPTITTPSRWSSTLRIAADLSVGRVVENASCGVALVAAGPEQKKRRRLGRGRRRLRSASGALETRGATRGPRLEDHPLKHTHARTRTPSTWNGRNRNSSQAQLGKHARALSHDPPALTAHNRPCPPALPAGPARRTHAEGGACVLAHWSAPKPMSPPPPMPMSPP